jgi:SAM-dependent methyltransferase
MREWLRYVVTDRGEGAESPIDGAGCPSLGYEIDEQEASRSFGSKEAYFKTFFHDVRRVRNYDNFIQETLKPGEKVLGVGSGRCANELMLMDRGYQVTCSDLSPPAQYAEIKELFPQVEHIDLDILAGPASERYDALICLSVIYAFGDDDLERFFDNAYQSLTDDGHLILDYSGSPDNALSYLVHDVLLKYEAKAARTVKSRSYPSPRVVSAVHHGYRRKDREILTVATEHGFEIVSQHNYDFLTEFERSFFLRQSIKKLPGFRTGMRQLGRAIPFTRMFDLKKT